MERFLAIASSLLVGACFVCAWRALLHFSDAEDVRGLIFGCISLTSGFAATRMLDPRGES